MSLSKNGKNSPEKKTPSPTQRQIGNIIEELI
jgi:hypothetical protein